MRIMENFCIYTLYNKISFSLSNKLWLNDSKFQPELSNAVVGFYFFISFQCAKRGLEGPSAEVLATLQHISWDDEAVAAGQ